MKRICFVLLFSFFLCVSFAQGSSDIKYKTVNQIDSSDIGSEIKIHLNAPSPSKNYISGDTIKLQRRGKDILFVQRSKRGVDYWYFDEQSLESLSFSQDQFVLLENFRLLERPPGKLKFKLEINFYDKQDHKKLIETKPEIIWLDDVEIAGIYIKI